MLYCNECYGVKEVEDAVAVVLKVDRTFPCAWAPNHLRNKVLSVLWRALLSSHNSRP